ncbi:glycine--tRNA ligase subunit beta [Kushneria aurantia]|uniref:Glycine--tRNA ligase beta subunit n=1 Tax=Kushneria aurantia TaxID=504092 RepID=A0ABV6G1S0_9GAMM|nr:glycine--tRNA ligase subunit beta [Kushneria aurantia]
MASDTSTASAQTLLIELGCEELPPLALAGLVDALATGIRGGLEEAGLHFGEVLPWATPRRLAVQITRLDPRQPDRDVERLGPAVAAAFDKAGHPTRAASGFAGSLGIEVSELSRIDTDKGERLGHRYTQPGETTAALLPEILRRAVDALPVPKRMRWGASRVEFSRPVHWLVALYGSEVVPCEVLGLSADRLTRGHRFHCPQSITLDHADDYLAQLESPGYVIADMFRRRDMIIEQVRGQARELGATAVIEEELLDEVVGLVEWPVALTGRFDERFLAVPRECLISSMQANQKYFHLLDADNNLMPAFITVSNIESRDPQQVIEGNERVIRPRLADAAFFYDTDRSRPLASRIEQLASVVFQKELGTMADKSARVSVLARAIAERIGADTANTERAAELSRCDLVTEMVLEFPELQGVMGMYYARLDGEDDAVADALYQQYLPRFAGDDIPAAATGQALAIADRLDTLIGIFGIGQRPTGTRDPFALRRAAIGVLAITVGAELDLDLRELLGLAAQQHDRIDAAAPLVDEVLDYMLDRFRSRATDAGMSAETFLAVRARPVSHPFDFERRLHAVHAFSHRDEAQALAAANKRVANILAKQDEAPADVDRARLVEPAERALFEAIEGKRAETAPLIANRDYASALDALAELKAPVDAFFDDVMVMSDDDALRRNRLALLAGLQGLFLEVADIAQLGQS